MDSLGSSTANSSFEQQQPQQMTSTPRRRGRPRLPPDEALFRKRASKKASQERNYEYVKLQLIEIQRRPESRARRAELDKLRWIALKAARAEAKSKTKSRVQSSDQIFFSSGDKQPLSNE